MPNYTKPSIVVFRPNFCLFLNGSSRLAHGTNMVIG